MYVTRIEAVTKTRYKVYIDGQFAFVLYRGELSRFHIREEAEVTQDTMDVIRNEVLVKRARLRALHLLNDMGRTESQLREKLRKGDYPPDIAENAIEYVKSFGYLDDYRYAVSFVTNRKDKKSRRELQMLLKNKGVSESVIAEAMEECYEKDDSAEAILRLLVKRGYDPETATREETQKQMAYLMRKGFSYDEVKNALSTRSINT